MAKHVSPRKSCAFKIFRVENTFSRLLRNAKGGAYALKDFLAFHTHKPENTTNVYHFLKVAFRRHALETYGNQLEFFCTDTISVMGLHQTLFCRPMTS